MKSKGITPLLITMALFSAPLVAAAENEVVATLDGAGYTSIQTAIDQAGDGDTVVLSDADIYLDETLEVAQGKNIIIDLNGCNITVAYNEESGRSLYALDNYGTLELKDSVGDAVITARGIENLENGKLVVNGGKYVSCDANGGAAIWNEADVTINGGMFTTVHVGTAGDSYGPGCFNNQGKALITGGEFNSVNKRTYAIISTGEIEITPAEGKTIDVHGAHGGLGIDAGTAVINGGTYNSDDYYGIYVSNDGVGQDPMTAAVTVNGGTFSGKNYSVWVGSDYNNPVNSTISITNGNFEKPLNMQEVARENAITVSGGTFAFPVSDGMLKDTYVCIHEENDTYSVVSIDEAIAKGFCVVSDGLCYKSVREAVENNTEVKLLTDINEDIVINEAKTVTIDLNGHKITNVSNHTISNYGKLTINGPGTVDNVTHQKAAVYNYVGGTAVLNDAVFSRSAEAGSSSSESGGNSYYVIINQGDITMNNLSVESSGKFSSLIENGWYNGKLNTTGTLSKMTINGGRYSGGLNTLKNDDYGYMIVRNGAEIISETGYSVTNFNEMYVYGGSFSGNLYNEQINDSTDKGLLYIYDADVNDGFVCVKADPIIYGGTFNTDVTPYMADGTAYSVAGDEYTVYSADNKITGAGTYMTPISGDTYDQLTTVTKTIGSESVNVNTLKFDITIGNDNKTQYTYKGNTTFTNATVLFGLVVTDIPEGETVTVTMQ